MKFHFEILKSLFRITWKFLSERHRSAARAICYGLASNTTDNWLKVSHILHGRLSPEERVCVAYICLRTLEADQRAKIYHILENLEERLGFPVPGVIDDIADEADFWATNSSVEERRAYLSAIIRHISNDDKQIVANFIKGRT